MIKNCGKLNDTHSNTTTSYFITVGNSRCVKGFDKKTSIFIILGINGSERNITIKTTKAFPNHFFKEKALQTNNSNPTI